MWAARDNRVEVAQLLIEKGALINEKNEVSQVFLSYAIFLFLFPVI